MLKQEHTTFYPVPVQELKQLQEDIKYIRMNLSKPAKTINDDREWLPRLDFIRICNISPSLFNIWRNLDKLNVKYVSRKLYVHRTDVDRYFNGEFSGNQ